MRQFQTVRSWESEVLNRVFGQPKSTPLLFLDRLLGPPPHLETPTSFHWPHRGLACLEFGVSKFACDLPKDEREAKVLKAQTRVVTVVRRTFPLGEP